MKTTRKPLRTLIAAAVLGLSVASPGAHAQQTWDGDTNTDFEDGANWVSGTAPTTSNTATFGSSLTPFQPTLTASRTIGGLIFNKSDGGWTLSGTGRTLTVGASGIVDNGTSGETNVDPKVAFTATRTFSTAGSTVKLNGGIELTGNGAMSGNTGTFNVASISYGTGGSAYTFTKSGSGSMAVNVLGAAQSGWVGSITLSNGGLRVGHNTALGGGTLTWNNSSFFGALADVTVANNFVHGPGTHTYTGDFSITRTGTTATTGLAGQARSFINQMGGGAVLTLTGDVYLSDLEGTGRTFTFNGGASTGTTLVSGNIKNWNGVGGTAGNITMNGGLVILSGTNTYTGTTSLSTSGQLIFATKASKTAATVTTNNANQVVGLGVGSDAAYYSASDVAALFGNTLTGFSANSGRIGIYTAAGNFDQTVALTGARGLVKYGANVLTLSQNNTYTGATDVRQGTLRVNGTTAADSAVTVRSGGTLGGTGTVAGTITVESGGTLSPGASIESLASGGNVWNGGGALTFEFSTDGSTGTAGAQWDLLAITGGLDLNGVSDVNPFTIELVTMLNGTTPGPLASWDPNSDATWAGFVTTTTGVSGFAANKFAFDVSGVDNTLTGTFSVVNNGNNLDLVYVAVPEPGMLAWVALSLAAVFLSQQRRSRG
jgi:fibronectin-binding autotransporter adhesin